MISTAWAQEAATAATATSASLGAMLFQYLPIVLIFGIFYMLVIRPQNQAAKDHQKMLEALKKGDVVVTEGGLVGELTKVSESFLTLRVNAEDAVTVARGSIRKMLSAEEAKGWEPATPGKKK